MKVDFENGYEGRNFITKFTTLIPFLIIPLFALSQPNPQDGYPARIKAISAQLKTDSLNYKLIWERLEMKVNLMGGFGPHNAVYSLKVDSVEKVKRKALYFDEFNNDFTKVFNNVIKLKRYDIVEEGDFYLNRVWFYFNMLEIDSAIESAKYLRDSASYSRYWQRGDYYNDWALYSLYNLYVINREYEEALKTINAMLGKKRNQNPKVLYAGGGSFLGFQDKIRLFEHFNKNEEILPFLKETCSAYFNWYFDNLNHKDEYHFRSSKENGFYFLKLIINYMNENVESEYAKFNAVYRNLHYQVNENYATINPDISDEKLKRFISELLQMD